MFLKDIMIKTTIEYSQASSLHGIQYIFESGGNLMLSRVIWMVLAIAAAVLGIVWSIDVGSYMTFITKIFHPKASFLQRPMLNGKRTLP